MSAFVDGTIHLWDSRTGSSVQQRSPIKTTGLGLRSFAWRPSSTPFVTFASVHTTEVRIWTAQPPTGTGTPNINVVDVEPTLVPPASLREMPNYPTAKAQRLRAGSVNVAPEKPPPDQPQARAPVIGNDV
ncbi:hypothetical protein DXG01_001337 [Tephrocybe rancida]|nr:hypothetical protein DXG01_001337 [Tephrocybe rancida]